MDRAEISTLRVCAHRLADIAKVETLRLFRRPGDVSNKEAGGGFDPVTAADRAAEQAMRQHLAEERPDDGILGEEFGPVQGSSGLTWVLDPIDGTRGYIAGTPTWGTLIAVSDADGPIYGLIDQPYIGERFDGGGGIAEMTGPLGRSVLATRAPRRLGEATVLTTYPEVGTKAEAHAFHAVAVQSRLTRYGMDCYGYALLAAGQVDLVIEAGLQPYDIQAPIGVIQAAGGIVTDWSGGSAHAGGRAIAAANASIHAEALAILQAAV